LVPNLDRGAPHQHRGGFFTRTRFATDEDGKSWGDHFTNPINLIEIGFHPNALRTAPTDLPGSRSMAARTNVSACISPPFGSKAQCAACCAITVSCGQRRTNDWKRSPTACAKGGLPVSYFHISKARDTSSLRQTRRMDILAFQTTSPKIPFQARQRLQTDFSVLGLSIQSHNVSGD
jgi:hypothetical protein